jgi:putative transposase
VTLLALLPTYEPVPETTSDLDPGQRVAALMVDGITIAEHCCVVALAILADGTKLPVGLWLGSTENTTVVTHLLADLTDRGLNASRGYWW